MRTHRRKFMPQFHDAVRSGAKQQTIRPWPAVVPHTGDRFIAESWTGAPYRSKVMKLAEGVISAPCEEITISPLLPFRITVGNRSLDDAEMEAFAKADGFQNAECLYVWFRDHHSLPCRGCLIQWRPLECPRPEPYPED